MKELFEALFYFFTPHFPMGTKERVSCKGHFVLFSPALPPAIHWQYTFGNIPNPGLIFSALQESHSLVAFAALSLARPFKRRIGKKRRRRTLSPFRARSLGRNDQARAREKAKGNGARLGWEREKQEELAGAKKGLASEARRTRGNTLLAVMSTVAQRIRLDPSKGPEKRRSGRREEGQKKREQKRKRKNRPHVCGCLLLVLL